jgi:hypothetical protein
LLCKVQNTQAAMQIPLFTSIFIDNFIRRKKQRCDVIKYPVVAASLYRASQEGLRESIPYVKVYRYNPKHLYPKLNGYGDNDQRKVWSSCGSTYGT